MDLILIPGMWLTGAVWRDVATELERRGHHVTAFPGAGEDPAHRSLDDYLAAGVAAVDAADRPLLVGHSAACTLAWLIADRRPAAVAGAALVGGFPRSDGGAYFSAFPVTDGVMAFPGWEVFDGPDVTDLDDAARERAAAATIAAPEGITAGTVHYTDEARFGVPVTLVCPEYSPDEARGWISDGDVPELAKVERLDYADIDSGHWPMISRPAELAELLDDIARRSG